MSSFFGGGRTRPRDETSEEQPEAGNKSPRLAAVTTLGAAVSQDGECQECGAEMVVGSLQSHLKTQHDIYMSCVLQATDTVPLMTPTE